MRRMSTATALRFRGLSRRFGRLKVLEEVSGEVHAGGVLFVTGANGCGKSTLLRCLAGLLAPDRGEIELTLGGSPVGAVERRRGVGFVAPDLTFYDELTAQENLEFFARLRRTPIARPLELADRLGLPLDRHVAALSSGMRQRLRWLFALLGEPALLLLDEPFQNLDPGGEAQLRGILANRLSEGGLAVIASPTPLSVNHVEQELRLGR